MAVIPRSKAEIARILDYMMKLGAVMDAQRMPAREVVDVYSNMLIIGLIRRRQESEADALETIDLLIDKLQGMRAAPNADEMAKFLIRNSVSGAADC